VCVGFANPALDRHDECSDRRRQRRGAIARVVAHCRVVELHRRTAGQPLRRARFDSIRNRVFGGVVFVFVVLTDCVVLLRCVSALFSALPPSSQRYVRSRSNQSHDARGINALSALLTQVRISLPPIVDCFFFFFFFFCVLVFSRIRCSVFGWVANENVVLVDGYVRYRFFAAADFRFCRARRRASSCSRSSCPPSGAGRFRMRNFPKVKFAFHCVSQTKPTD
jgi:hypothetical protein